MKSRKALKALRNYSRATRKATRLPDGRTVIRGVRMKDLKRWWKRLPWNRRYEIRLALEAKTRMLQKKANA